MPRGRGPRGREPRRPRPRIPGERIRPPRPQPDELPPEPTTPPETGPPEPPPPPPPVTGGSEPPPEVDDDSTLEGPGRGQTPFPGTFALPGERAARPFQGARFPARRRIGGVAAIPLALRAALGANPAARQSLPDLNNPDEVFRRLSGVLTRRRR